MSGSAGRDVSVVDPSAAKIVHDNSDLAGKRGICDEDLMIEMQRIICDEDEALVRTIQRVCKEKFPRIFEWVPGHNAPPQVP